jgi:hypothetical protein
MPIPMFMPFMPFMPPPNPPFINMFCIIIGSMLMPGIPFAC